MAPVIIEKLVDPTSIIIDAKSGTSGAGRKPSRMNMHAEMSENFKIYKVNEHQHIPEIEQQLLIWNKRLNRLHFPHTCYQSQEELWLQSMFSWKKK